ncbi:unnamed protein product [Symbiodinium sp. CCMP2592]|nr:unnamed protein product [Symbiodinium sp. CCMP2592]
MVGIDPLPSGDVTTAWNFNGSVYCAYNDTVYEILYEFASHLGVTDVVDRTGEVFVGPAGAANTSQVPITNDGLNCPGSSPFAEVTTTTSTTTTTTPEPLQVCNTTEWNCSNTSSFSTLALQAINEQPLDLPPPSPKP